MNAYDTFDTPLGDFTAAVRLIDQGMKHEPSELTLRAAGAAQSPLF